ncbi:MAG: hypothetical protein KDK75_08640 [Alphaproteobacteria bacterium]|nr:hypothetical protein [Alphaproteobacteria bacterium]
MDTQSNLFMFRASTESALWAFDADPKGTHLPEKFGPWTAIGVMRPDQSPPGGLSRTAIQRGIAKNGFQLWRKKQS